MPESGNHVALAILGAGLSGLRSRCLQSFLDTAAKQQEAPRNYEEWLHQAMGPVFADTFPAAYTRKYWTCEPRDLDVDWIGLRVLRPEAEDVVAGAKGPLPNSMYYVNTRSARYPSRGGFWSYTHKLAQGADIRYGMRLESINFGARSLRFENGTEVTYDRLASERCERVWSPRMVRARDREWFSCTSVV